MSRYNIQCKYLNINVSFLVKYYYVNLLCYIMYFAINYETSCDIGILIIFESAMLKLNSTLNSTNNAHATKCAPYFCICHRGSRAASKIKINMQFQLNRTHLVDRMRYFELINYLVANPVYFCFIQGINLGVDIALGTVRTLIFDSIFAASKII